MRQASSIIMMSGRYLPLTSLARELLMQRAESLCVDIVRITYYILDTYLTQYFGIVQIVYLHYESVL